jgi:putative transposase
MGRPLRQAVGGIVYHVLNRRVLRLPLFEDEGDYLAFEKVLLQAMQREDAPELFTFCLMPRGRKGVRMIKGRKGRNKRCQDD